VHHSHHTRSDPLSSLEVAWWSAQASRSTAFDLEDAPVIRRRGVAYLQQDQIPKQIEVTGASADTNGVYTLSDGPCCGRSTWVSERRHRFIRFNGYDHESWEISKYQSECCHHAYAVSRTDSILPPEGWWRHPTRLGFVARVTGEAHVRYVEDVKDVVYSLDAKRSEISGSIAVTSLSGESVAEVALHEGMTSDDFWSLLEEQQPHLRAVIKLVLPSACEPLDRTGLDDLLEATHQAWKSAVVSDACAPPMRGAEDT